MQKDNQEDKSSNKKKYEGEEAKNVIKFNLLNRK